MRDKRYSGRYFYGNEGPVRNWNSKIYTSAADLANKLKGLNEWGVAYEYEVVMIDDKNQGVKVYWDSTDIALRIEENEKNIEELKAVDEA